MRRTVLWILALVAGAGGASAQQELPPAVTAAIEESRRECGADETFVTQRGFVTRRDINGDRIGDVILDYEHVECGGFASRFCGTGGCLFQVFASHGGDYIKVMDHTAYSVRFERRRGRPAMIQLRHRSHCERPEVETGCRSVTYWNGSRFAPTVAAR